MSRGEMRARARKANRLAVAIHQNGHRAAEALDWNDEMRRTACFIANVQVASDITWSVVIGVLGVLDAMDDAGVHFPFDPRSAHDDEPVNG